MNPSDALLPGRSLDTIQKLTRSSSVQKQQVAEPVAEIPRSKQKTRVLDEDEFVKSLSAIIQRDFFPDLPKLRSHVAFMDALEAGDESRMKEIAVEYLRSQEGEAESSTIKAPSVDAFLAKYTSEDNASFDEIIEKQNEKQREKFRWLYDRADRLMLEAGPSADSSKRLLESSLPSGVKHSKTIKTWEYKPQNALMYYPEGVGSTLSVGNESRGNPKAIQHSNTRLCPEEEEEIQKLPDATTSQSLVIGGASATQLRLLSQLDSGPGAAIIRLNATRKYSPSARPQEAATPVVGGYSMVSRSPSPEPIAGAPGATPVLTWGEVESTPLLLDAKDVGPLNLKPAGGDDYFKIPEPPKRDQLGKKLADDATKSLRKRQDLYRPKPSPIVSSGKVEKRKDFSPAAQLLLKNTRFRSPYPLSGAGTPLINDRAATPTLKRTAKTPLTGIIKRNSMSGGSATPLPPDKQ